MTDTAAIILAAGKGTRMKSGLVKVMHQLEGVPMAEYAIRAAREADAGAIALVVGHQAEKVREHFAADAQISLFVQEEQLGTGHAVACAGAFLEGRSGDVFILCGDVPLIEAATLQALHEAHVKEQATVTILTAVMANPFGYGRIVKNDAGRVMKIVEEKDASAEEKKITEINAGIYCVEAAFLREAVQNLSNDNAQGEYYLTEIVDKAVAAGRTCISKTVAEPEEVMGINDRVQLAEAAKYLRRRTNRRLMIEGVTIIDPDNTYIAPTVAVGADTIIYPNVHLQGKTAIGKGCTIEPSVIIADCTIGDGCHIKAGSILHDSEIGNEVAVGPMAHLRPGSVLHDHVKIGNFVETKKAVMGEGSKASHLTYLGDAEIGKDVNIGCGTITCNYDGVRKHKTVIEDGVFVGSDVQLVAPVTVGARSLIAAGTTVTKDVPADSLAISRTPQVNKDGYMKKPKG